MEKVSDSEFRNYIFNSNIGIMFIDISANEIVFKNGFFEKLSKDDYYKLSEKILSCTGTAGRRHIHQEIKLNPMETYGFSIYAISRGEKKMIALVSEISSKQIYLEAQNYKSFFKKLSKQFTEIAHEVGNPLTSVIMTLQVLLKNIKKWDLDKKSEFIETSVKELQRLSNFMNRIRKLSKNNNFDIHEYCLEEILSDVILQNKVRLKQNKIDIINEVTGKCCIFVDEEAIRQVLFNLIQNSLDILEPGDKIGFCIEGEDDMFTRLVYFNTGPPISESNLKKIFFPSFSTKKEGSGIGLNLCMKNMTGIGGTIKAQNYSKGVKFILYLPNSENRDPC